MSAGFLYVLANSSMPGLVKVGKTTRSASARADELSAATGVATPFIVVYERYFTDCDAAESFVHTKLSADGLRQAHNREFFRASVTEVLNAILSMPYSASERQLATEDPEELLTAETPEFASLRLAVPEPTAPWASVLEEGDRHYYGFEGYLQDFTEAMKCYRNAARLGSAKAFERLGDMYERGEGVRENAAMAIQLYKEGAKKENYRCYAGLARAFIRNKQIENAEKCIHRFIEAGTADGWKAFQSFNNDHILMISAIIIALEQKLGADHQLLSAVETYIPAVVADIRAQFANPAVNPDPDTVNYFRLLANSLEQRSAKAAAISA